MFKHVKSFLFENSNVRQTVAKNTFWLAVSNFGGRFLRAFVIIYAARVLGPAEWGVFNYTITIVAFLTLFGDSGVSQVLIRNWAQTADEVARRTLIATTFRLKMLFVAAGAILIIFVAPHLPTADANTTAKAALLFPIVACIMIFDSIREFYQAILHADERMEWETVSYGFTNLFIVGFGFLFLAIHPTVRAFTVAYAAGAGAGTLVATFFVRKYLRGILTAFSSTIARNLFRSIWPFAISGVLGMLMINADIIMLGWFRSSTEVGWYSAPQRIIQLIYLIPSLVSLSVLPAFSRFAAQSKEKMTSAIEYAVSAAYMVALPITAGGIIVAHGLIRFIFGEQFVPGALPFQILLLTLLADFSALLLSNVIVVYNRQKNLVVYSALGGFTNIALNLLLIPKYGVIGCALATLCAQLVSNFYLQTKVRSINPFHITRHLKNALFATAAMAVTVFALQSAGVHVAANIAVGIIVYFGILYLRREPLLREVRNVLFPQATPTPAETAGQ